jgi:pyridoxal phosphate enzyme (YggS family)
MAQLIALDPERVRANLAAVRERIAAACSRAGRDPSEVELLAATKYVAVEELGALADAGITLIGENIAGDLAEKRARWGDRFTYDFIGHLQSRKAKVVNDLCELCHSLASESAAKRLTIPALVEVNLSGEPTKSGIPPEELPNFLELYGDVRGLMTMPPASDDPEASRPYFRRLRELAEAHSLRDLSMGTSQDYRIAVEEGATYIRVGSTLFAQ